MTVGTAFEESSLHGIETPRIRRLYAAILGVFAICAPVLRAEVAWSTASPEKHGFEKAKLDALRDRLAPTTKAFLVARDGVLIYEWYGQGTGPNQRHYTASLAKSLVGGMSLAIAMNDGLIRPGDPAWEYIPAWKDDPQKSKITIRHLASHSSGIEDAHADGIPHEQLSGWMGAFWRRKPDPFGIALHQAPLIAPPGTRYHYSNPGMAALAYAVTASIKNAAHSDIRTLLDKRLFTPIGLESSDWSVGYAETTELDGMKLIANWGGGAFTPRATARVGQLLLAQGKWDGRQLIDAEVLRKMVAYGGTPIPDRVKDVPRAASALGWHINTDGFWKGVPRDAFAGLGAGNQVLLVVPSLNLIMVRNGAQFAGDGSLAELLFRPLVQAMTSNPPPYPPSPVIRKITFNPEPEIIRKAIGSDNWPITWADDDDMYTSYGDGWGFEPTIKTKLSLGLARITGVPPDFEGINIRSESAERAGDGAKGPKASGMLMVDGILYMWVRNTGNAQLVWSADHGRTWDWGFRFETSFGSPAFVNFGKNYHDARDQYVYTISQDGPSAYESDDGIILARVRKTGMRNRSQYDFFMKLAPNGSPVWTKNINQRGHILRYPGNCQRTDIVYNPGLKRYMMALSYGHSGGWGIYDAPEPWGPWTTAFHTNDWGLGGTHGYRLPSKWISSDGRTMHLIFSGVKLPSITYDAFCVRRFSIETAVER